MKVVHLPIDHADALEHLQAAMRFAVDAPVGRVADVRALIRPGMELLGIQDDAGQLKGAFLLTVLNTPYGSAIRCLVAAGGADVDLTALIADTSEDLAKAHGSVAAQCVTKRRGLVAKLKSRGYRVAGYLLQKDMVLS